MDINDLPAGTNCLVDTNIFLYHLVSQSNDCRQLLLRIGRGELSGYVTTSIISEMLHKRIVIEAVSIGLVTGAKPFEKLKRQPQSITRLSNYFEPPPIAASIRTTNCTRVKSSKTRTIVDINDLPAGTNNTKEPAYAHD